MIYAQNINCNFLWDDIHVYILHHITLDRGMDQNLYIPSLWGYTSLVLTYSKADRHPLSVVCGPVRVEGYLLGIEHGNAQ